jgi:predicted phage terminase large subunit-like protein
LRKWNDSLRFPPTIRETILNEVKAQRAELARQRKADEARADADKIRRKCSTLSGFINEAWPILEPEARYIPSWHVDAIAEHLTAVSRGQITRLLMNFPPGSMKSLTTSVTWQAFEWGPLARRSMRYICTAFNELPVKRDSRKTRDLILSEWYQTLWPEVKLVRSGELSFANSDTGSREAIPFVSLTSQRGDRLILDDPHSTKTAESDLMREETTRLFREGALNRLNDQKRSAIVIMMQRMHARDISGVIEDLQMDFCKLVLPMRFEAERRCVTVIGFKDPREHDGELLCPARFDEETCVKLEKEAGAYAWAGQYQQRPAPREGGMIKRRWFEVVPAAPLHAKRVRKWDLAGTRKIGKSDPDWTVGALLARDPQGIVYVEHLERLRESSNTVETTVLNTAAQDRARYGRGVIVGLPEDAGQAGKAQASWLAARLAGYVVRVVREDRSTGGKAVRATPFASQAEAGNVRIVAGEWNEALFAEIDVFPAGAHDDQVDAVAGAFNLLVERSSADEWVDHYAHLAALAQGGGEAIESDERFALPWARGARPATPKGNELTELYQRALDAHQRPPQPCAVCGRPLAGTEVSDGVNVWHPDCYGVGLRMRVS